MKKLLSILSYFGSGKPTATSMTRVLEKFNQVHFRITEDDFLDALNACYKSVSGQLTENEKRLLRYDLDYIYNEKGRWLIHTTFAGGIIFLREPETIDKIDIHFRSDVNEVFVAVDYASEKRNARNVKYKPKAGKTESTTWPLERIFPNFKRHKKDIQLILMLIIGKITQHICEDYRKNSWFMLFEKPFTIYLFLDAEQELICEVTIH